MKTKLKMQYFLVKKPFLRLFDINPPDRVVIEDIVKNFDLKNYKKNI